MGIAVFRARVFAAGRAPACERPVFGHDPWLGFGQVEHLARGRLRGHRGTQGCTAPAAGCGGSIDRGIRCFDMAECRAAIADVQPKRAFRARNSARNASYLAESEALSGL